MWRESQGAATGDGFGDCFNAIPVRHGHSSSLPLGHCRSRAELVAIPPTADIVQLRRIG